MSKFEILHALRAADIEETYNLEQQHGERAAEIAKMPASTYMRLVHLTELTCKGLVVCLPDNRYALVEKVTWDYQNKDYLLNVTSIYRESLVWAREVYVLQDYAAITAAVVVGADG